MLQSCRGELLEATGPQEVSQSQDIFHFKLPSAMRMPESSAKTFKC